MGFHNFSCYNPMQAQPDLDLQGPSGILVSAENRSISPTSTSSNSSNSPSGSTVKRVGNALDVEATGEDTAQTNKKQYDKWTNEEQKALINHWADQHEQLESKDVQKIWDEIALEINRKFGTTHLGEKCQKKMKYLIERYKKAKDCQDVVTLRHVAEAGTSTSTSAPNSDASESNNSELPGKKKRKRAKPEEGNEGDLIKSSMLGMEKQ